MASAFSGLERLLSNLRTSNHDFKSTTEVFPQLDVEKIAKEMSLADLGNNRGKENLPLSSARSLDDAELTIIERVEDAKTTAFNNLEDQLHLFSLRLANLDFQGQFSIIEKTNAESLTDFKGETVKGKAQLHTLRRSMYEAVKDLDTFQRKNNLDRSAISIDSGSKFMKVGLLVLFFMVEWVANGFFLSEGSRLGFIGGVMEAALFALLNICATVIITIFGIKNLTHRSYFRKFFGLTSLIFYISFALSLNLLLAHYRELSGNLLDGIGVEAIKRFTNGPFSLEDVKSWMLFAAGFLLSVFTAIDAWHLSDPYVGYQAVSKRRQEAEENYKNKQSELIDELIGLRDDHHEKIEAIIAQLHSRRREHGAVIAHRSKLITLFTEYQMHLERATNQLLRRYRDTNIAARTNTSPKYFNSSFKLERMKPSLEKAGELSDKQIAEAIKKAQAELSEQIKAISNACEDGISEYRELDNLFPEKTNG